MSDVKPSARAGRLVICGVVAVGACVAVLGGVIARFHSEEFRLTSIPTPTFARTPIVVADSARDRIPVGGADTRYTSCASAFAETLPFGRYAEICSRPKRLTDERGVEIDLTAGTAFLFEDGKIVGAEPVAYQSPEGAWYEAPTGYYRIGARRETHRSSLFPVTMPWSLQYYEDFFLHGIPYHDDGTPVTSAFTGGCLRFVEDVARTLYEFLHTGDQVAVYKTFKDVRLKEQFSEPADLGHAWIRQRFINPYRAFYRNGGSLETLREDYYSHTGIDIALDPKAPDETVRAIADGTIALVQRNDGRDHGLGNTVLLEFNDHGTKRYALYGHLDSVVSGIVAGAAVRAGDALGVMGDSGNGCGNYWRVGAEGCSSANPRDTHLHFEIKDAPVVGNPEGGDACKRTDGSVRPCYGYTPDYPQRYGYRDPVDFLFDHVQTGGEPWLSVR